MAKFRLSDDAFIAFCRYVWIECCYMEKQFPWPSKTFQANLKIIYLQVLRDRYLLARKDSIITIYTYLKNGHQGQCHALF